MPHLPPELISIILERVYYTPDGSPDYPTLANCSLSCTSWNGPAQTLLYRKVKLNPGSAKTFQAALESSAARGRSVSHEVRVLDFVCIDSLDVELFVQLVEVCPKLYKLSISPFALGKFDSSHVSRLRDAGQSVRALNLRNCYPESAILFQLLAIWPRIQFLTIAGGYRANAQRHAALTAPLNQQKSSGNADGPLVACVSLYSLKLWDMPDTGVLSWLLGSSSSSLRILDIPIRLPNAVERKILSIHAPHVRSLCLPSFSIDIAAFLGEFTCLEELIFRAPSLGIPLAPHLPPSIEHLSFQRWASGSDLAQTLLHLLDAIDVLPKLRVLSCDKYLEQFPTLKAKCMRRGIEVRVIRGALEMASRASSKKSIFTDASPTPLSC